MAESRVAAYISRLKDYEREKQPWLRIYQDLAEIFLTRNADFTRTMTQAEFIEDAIFDNTPQHSAMVAASVFLSMLWPDSARTFRLQPVSFLKGLPGVDAYFRAMTDEMHTAMDRPQAGLQLALMGHFLDQVVFGVSGIAAFDGPEDHPEMPVVYEAWDAKVMCIAENPQGFVDVIFAKTVLTVRQVIMEYGGGRPGDRVSVAVKEAYEQGKYEDKIEILKVLEPKKREAGKRGLAAMAYRSVHIDVQNRMMMREGGFEEMPVAVARLIKRSNETQGRSCGMVALPSAKSLNALTEAILVATEKQLDPPMAVSDDARLGGGVLDTSASAINVVNMSGRLGAEKPIFPLFTVGEMQSADKLKEQLIAEVTQAFFLDRLLDLNNKTMMTAYETSVRNRLRGESTGSVFARQIMESLSPTIRRSFNLMFRKGYFGIIEEGPGALRRAKWRELTGKDLMVVPEAVKNAVAAGLDIYEIQYISPAQRFMQAEKLQGLFTAQDSIAALAPIYPTITHGVDPDKLRTDIYELSGSPIGSLRTQEETEAVRAAEAERQNAAVALEAGKGMADIAAKTAQGRMALGTIPRG